MVLCQFNLLIFTVGTEKLVSSPYNPDITTVHPYNQNFSLHQNEVNKLQDGTLQQPNFVDVTKG
jgi:hypothetical protein